MRVAVVNLTQGGLSGGSRKYLRHLIPLLQRDQRVGRLALFVHSRTVAELQDTHLEVESWPADDLWRRYATLKSTLRKLAPDVIFFPTARWLAVGGIPTVIMVHNMEPLVAPVGGNRPGEVLKNLLRAYAARVACRRATRIIAVSRYVHDFLRQRWGIHPDKMGLVYHGVEQPCSEDVPPSPAWLPRDWQEHFIFTAGSLRPYRGLEDIVRALALLRDRRVVKRVVIAGVPDPGMHFYRRRLACLASQYRVADHIVWAGQLTPCDMAWCFSHCAAFVMTSRVEACPNIALEAMSHGCLCVSSNNLPMPEFFGDAALYYQSGDAHSLAQQLTVLSDASAQQQAVLRRRAQLQTRQFRWEKTAQETITHLELAIGQGLSREGRSGALIERMP